MTSANALKLSKEYLAGFIDGEGYITYDYFTNEKSKGWRRFKVIGKVIRELSERMSEASYLSHEQRYKVSSEIDEFIRGVGL